LKAEVANYELLPALRPTAQLNHGGGSTTVLLETLPSVYSWEKPVLRGWFCRPWLPSRAYLSIRNN